MSKGEENVAAVREALEAFQRNDMEKLLTFLDPDIETYSSPQLLNPVQAVGRDAWLRWIGDWLEAWGSFEVEAIEIEPVGENHVLTTMRQHGTGKGSGVEVQLDVFYMFELRDGVTIRYHLYPTREEALQAAQAGEAAVREAEPAD